MRNKIFLLLFTVIQIVSCNNVGNNCKIIGTVSDSITVPEDAKAILYIYGDETVETETPIFNGSFKFNVSADNTKMMDITLSGNGLTPNENAYTVSVIAEKGKIYVNLGENTVKGGKINESLNSLQNSLMDIYFKDQDAIMAAYTSGDMTTAHSLGQMRDDAIIALCEDAYKANPDNHVGLQALSMLISTKGNRVSTDEMNNLMAMAGEIIKQDERIQRMASDILAYNALNDCDKVPDIIGKDKDGAELSLYSIMDGTSYILMDFWASWCGPCIESVPVIKEIRQECSNLNLKIVGVNCFETDVQNGIAAIEQESMDWPVILASDDEVNKYGVSVLPTFIILSPEGKMLDRCESSFDLLGLKDKLASYFN